MAARTRTGGGVMAYAVALVIFVVLFVASLAAAILAYAQVGDLRQNKDKAEAENARLVLPGERQSDKDIRALIAGATATKSVVGTLSQENRDLKTVIGVDPQTPVKDIEGQMPVKGLLSQLKDTYGIAVSQGLINEITRLRKEKDDSDARIKDLTQRLADAGGRATTAEKGKKTLDDDYEKAKAGLTARLTDLTNKHGEYDKTVKAEQAKLTEQLETLQKEYQDGKAKSQAKIDEQGTEITKLKKIIDDLRRPSGTARVGVDPILLADGHIVALALDQQLVYIDIGRAEHLALGTTFAVYDRNTPIAKDQFGDLSGKATIEVIQVGEHSSTARIVRLERGRTLVEGDKIANVVYDPNMVYKFFIYGDFDLDRTGQPVPGDKRRLESMVSGWGGKVVDAFSYDVDFVVLGQEPKPPEPLPAGTVDPTEIEKHAKAQAAFDSFLKLKAEADKYRIPILNQNRFLALVGYYQR